MYATIISAGIALFIVSAAHGMNNPQRTPQEQEELQRQRAQEERAVNAAYARTMRHIILQAERAARAERADRIRLADGG